MDDINNEINEDSQKAIALSYNENGEGAPVIISKGQGKLAFYILEKAQENQIAVIQDEDLVEVLYNMPEGMEIPYELYSAVAEIYIFLYTTHKKFKNKGINK